MFIDDLKVDDYRRKSGIKTRFLALRKLSSKKGRRITNVASSVILEGEDYGSKVSIKHL
jgi:hypothetical protein